MIEINGEHGGGQILRTALGLSILTQKPFKIINIRKNRPNPGLKEQHIQSIQALKKLSNAEVTGNYFSSQELTFIPNKIETNSLDIKISTAGSQALVLQSILIASLNSDLEVNIEGGATSTFFAPPVSHMQRIFYKLLEKMNYKVQTKILKEGFFPKGGAKSKTIITHSNLKPLNIIEKGELERITILGVASKELGEKKVAGRLAKSAKKILENNFQIPIKVVTSYVNSNDPGCSLQIISTTENSILGSDGIGEKGITSEKIGEKAANELIEDYNNGSIDRYSSDMLLPFIAIAGGSYQFPKMTNHIKTSINVIEQFLDAKFEIKDNLIQRKDI